MPRFEFEVETVYETLTFPVTVEANNWEEARDKVVAHVDNGGGPRPRPTKVVFRSIKKNGAIFERRRGSRKREIADSNYG